VDTAKGQAVQPGQTGTQNLSLGGGPTEMRTGGSGAFLGQQWDPSQWNTDLGLGYYGVPAGQQQGFAQGASMGNGAKGQAGNDQWPAWSGSEPHPLVQIANHIAGIMSGGGESDSGGSTGGEATGDSSVGAADSGSEDGGFE